MSTLGQKTGQAKRDDISDLLDRLRQDRSDKPLSPAERRQLLEQLKVYGRNPSDSDAIFERSGIETLGLYGLDDAAIEVSREALRCLANALLLEATTRPIFIDLGFVPKLAVKLKSNNSDDEFLISRILFLTTYAPPSDFKSIVKDHGLADSIARCLARHAERCQSKSNATTMDDMALTETCKLIFNIIHFQPELTACFDSSIPYVEQIICSISIPRPALQTPLSAAINCLLNLNLQFQIPSDSKETDDQPDTTGNDATHQQQLVDRLAEILDLALQQYKETELDQTAAPLITLLRKIYPISTQVIQSRLRASLLPAASERDKPLGKSDTLASRLLKLMTSALAPTLGQSVAAMLYELSDSDPNKLVQSIGYGYASGFLMRQGLPVPANAGRVSGEDGAEDINPITGQRRDTEVVDEGPPMTDEEKEREAERLFVLFERLKATGVMKVKNPVEQAIDEGRFEELPD